MLAEILINRPSKNLDRTFTYRIPDDGSVGVGWRVAIPFGSHTEEGIVLSVREEEALSYSVKNVIAPVDEFPWFTPEMLALANWISLYYLCTQIDALRLFLIDKKGIQITTRYAVAWEFIPEGHPIRTVLDASVEELSEEDAEMIFGDALSAYGKSGLLERMEIPEAVYRMPIEREYRATETGNEALTKRQQELVAFVSSQGVTGETELAAHGFSKDLLKKCVEKGAISLFYKEKTPYSLIGERTPEAPRELTEEQAAAFETVKAAIDADAYRGQLLMGVTGSGKTEVYLRAAEHARELGGSVLLLVPEIALTTQMVDYFAKRFGDDVVFIHSKLSKGERYNNRQRIRTGQSHIAIGSRSALFLPFQNLRLIIVDEEYDSSYKQDETPFYNARDAAKKLAAICGCPILLGAATPSIVTYAAAEAGVIDLIEMPHRVKRTPLPKFTVIDMKDEAGVGNETLYSRELLARISQNTEEGKKTILFLNRRGYATTLRCQDCGHVFKCPHCDVSLVYHKARHRLSCHYCESVYPVPRRCPDCKGEHIAFLGRGTERVEEQLKEWLPEIKALRLDLDSTSRKYSAAKILEEFREGAFPVLLGTQMVVKGHDIPGVQLVGILNADSLYNMPTYLAGEQAYTMITQCAGRAGRGEERGNVVLQTYEPDHYIIRAAVEADYKKFYQKEVSYRQAMQYPPYVRLLRITSFSAKYETARKRAEALYEWLLQNAPAVTPPISFVAPYDEAVKKIRNQYYVSILVRGQNLAALKAKIREAEIFRQNGIILDVDPLS